jgi:hypothetical protein
MSHTLKTRTESPAQVIGDGNDSRDEGGGVLVAFGFVTVGGPFKTLSERPATYFVDPTHPHTKESQTAKPKAHAYRMCTHLPVK